MSKYLITLEVESDSDPAYWNYDYFLNLDLTSSLAISI